MENVRKELKKQLSKDLFEKVKIGYDYEFNNEVLIPIKINEKWNSIIHIYKDLISLEFSKLGSSGYITKEIINLDNLGVAMDVYSKRISDLK